MSVQGRRASSGCVICLEPTSITKHLVLVDEGWAHAECAAIIRTLEASDAEQ